MLQKYFISLTLLLVFSIGLAHDIIPHHHHDVEDLHSHSHHHDGSTSHNHDHSEEEDLGYVQHDEPLGYFSHAFHFIAYNEFECTSTQNVNVRIDANTDLYLPSCPFISYYIPFWKGIEVRGEEPYYYAYSLNKQFCKTTQLIRGPPTQCS